MYLLNNPDHYTSHEFKTFFWMSYIQEAWKVWVIDPNDRLYQEKVQLLKRKDKVVGFSPVDDYIYRPCDLEKMCLYDWVSQCSRMKFPRSKKAGTPNVDGVKREEVEGQDDDDDVDNSADEGDNP